MIDGWLQEFVDQRHAVDRHDHGRKRTAEEPGLGIGVPAAKPDQRSGPDREDQQHYAM
jgi:hypothetical protein